MHMHGFFYDVLSRESPLKETVYRPKDRRRVVTEFMFRQTTMVMEWVPKRPGNWLFHCHLSFHVDSDVRLPGTAHSGEGQRDVHMAGLVIGNRWRPFIKGCPAEPNVR